MKLLSSILFVAFCLVVTGLYAQTTPNRMSVNIDGKVYKAEPRKIAYGQGSWITGNTVSPDKSLRIGIGNWASPGAYTPGKYLVCDPDKEMPQDQRDKLLPDGFVGVAFINYVEETKAPRMAYHKGTSACNNEIMILSIKNDSTIIEFQKLTLNGTHWKEKVTTTVLGGVSRLETKMIDKGKTKASGYEVDIDPEHNGYKKESETDQIILSGGRVSLYNK